MMKKLFLVALIGCFYNSFAQKDYSKVYNNDSIIKKGIFFYDSNKYDDALKEYGKIEKIDPEYLTAQYEKILTLLALKKNDQVRITLGSLYKSDQMSDLPKLFTLYGSFLSDEKEYDLAEKIFKEGEKYIPNSTNHLYNFAVLYIRKEDRQKSIDILEHIITIDPNSASSHYLLGLIALEDGKIVEGTMALLSYLTIAPNGIHAKEAITKLNSKYGENFLEKGKYQFSKSGDNFEEIEIILRNQLPLRKAYKIQSEIDDVYIRQIQAVAEYSVTHKMENGFFETTYIPWIKDVFVKNKFEGLSYYILLSLEDVLGKKLTSQKKKINDFYKTYYTNDLWNNFGKRKLDHYGKQEEVIISIENRVPYTIGAFVDGKKEGKYKLLNKDGNTIGDLNLKNDNLEGVQKYYDDKGNLTVEKNFVNGKLDGKKTTYYSNGLVYLIENYKEDKLQGLSTSFYVNGGKHCEVNFVNDEREGKFICLYPNGTKNTEIDYSNGKLNGKYLVYNQIGDVTESSDYVNGELNGKYTEYYDGKTIKAEVNYSNGKIQNSYKSYYSNGLVKKESFYENGKIKKAIEYFANGKKSIESIYDENEELELYTMYDNNEIKYFDQKFKSGELKLGLQYSKNNPNPVEVSLSKKPFEIKDLDGVVLISGNFIKGKKDGEWNYYTNSGILKTTNNYKNDKLEGLSYGYENGLLESIVNYSNDTLSGVYETYKYGKLNKIFNYVKGIEDGPYKTFYPDGTLKEEGFYKDGELNYNKLSYWQNGKISRKEKFIADYNVYSQEFNQNGTLENTYDYKNKSGKLSTKYNNGSMIHDFELINGNLNGKYITKDVLNNYEQESEFVNGVRNNSTKSYNPNGSILYESNYYSGNENGIEKRYDFAGNMKMTVEYQFGVENGKTVRYFHNKSKFNEYNKVNGVVEGDCIYYNQEGEPILILGYKNDKIKYYIAKNKTGKLTDKIEIVNQTGEITSNYPNGKIAVKFNLSKGLKEGKFIINNPDGRLEYEANYKNDLFDGERNEFYTNGKLYKKERFVINDYEGQQEYFKEDGKPWLKSEYKNDELNGNTLIYANGTLSLTKKYNSDELVEIIK